jgi:hypothetical protein
MIGFKWASISECRDSRQNARIGGDRLISVAFRSGSNWFKKAPLKLEPFTQLDQLWGLKLEPSQIKNHKAAITALAANLVAESDQAQTEQYLAALPLLGLVSNNTRVACMLVRVIETAPRET